MSSKGSDSPVPPLQLRQLLAAGTLLVALMLCSACGGRGSSATAMLITPASPALEQPGTPLAGFPAPSQLQRGTSEPPNELLRYKSGHDWDDWLPNENVFDSHFYPDWQDPSSGLENAAYACYRFFGMQEYDDEARVRLLWYDPAPPAGNVWLGMANWDSNRWDWYAMESGDVALPGMDQYISDGGMIVAAVLLLGSDDSYLNKVIIGSNVTPIVFTETDLNQNPAMNFGPLLVNVDSSKTWTVGGEITSFDFDFEGDGVYEITGNTDGMASHTYEPGNYTLTVRAYESSGKAGIGTKYFPIIDPDNQPPVAELHANITAGSAPLAVGFDGLASSDADGYIIKYEYDFDNDGEYDLETDSPEAVQRVMTTLGINLVRLRVTDNFLATATDSVNVTLDSGWKYTTVEPSITLDTQLAMGVSGENETAYPCMLYLSEDTSELFFRRATSAAGTSWEARQEPAPFEARFGGQAGLDIAYSPVNHAPLICYSVFDDGGDKNMLYTVAAQDETGVGWNSPQLAYGTLDTGRYNSLAIMNSLPALVTVRNPIYVGISSIQYILAKDPLGTSWNLPVEVKAGVVSSHYTSVELLPSSNGFSNTPLVFCTRTSSDSQEIYAIRATDVDGTSWEEPDVLGSAWAYGIDATLVDGRPAFSCSSTSQNGSVYYGRADDAKGQQWSGSMQQLGKGGYSAIGIWGGRPCICYHDPDGYDLKLVRALDAQGSDWEEPQYVYSRKDAGLYCDMVIVNDRPVIGFWDKTNSKLLVASWQFP